MKSKVAAATSSASYFRFGLGDNANETFGILPGYEAYSVELLSVTSTRGISVAPFITPATRSAFQSYALENIDLLGGDSNFLRPQIQKGIFYKLNGVNTPYLPNATDSFFFPVWQIAPISSNMPVIMYDLYSEANRKRAIDIVIATKAPTATDIIQLVQDTAINVQRASGLVMAPIYPKSDINSTTLIGIASAVFSWDDVLRMSLPATAGVWLVLSSETRKFSFLFENGVLTNLGNRDFTQVADYLLKYKRSTNFALGVKWTLDSYPTEAMHTSFMTTLPKAITIAVVAAIVMVALVFVMYDCLASGRFEGLNRIASAASHLIESKAYDFQTEVNELKDLNTAAGFSEVVVAIPKEIDRKFIQTDGVLGAGAFGRVLKV